MYQYQTHQACWYAEVIERARKARSCVKHQRLEVLQHLPMNPYPVPVPISATAKSGLEHAISG